MTNPEYCFDRKKDYRFLLSQTYDGHYRYVGSFDENNNSLVRGKIFKNSVDICKALHINDKAIKKRLYKINDHGTINEKSLYDELKDGTLKHGTSTNETNKNNLDQYPQVENQPLIVSSQPVHSTSQPVHSTSQPVHSTSEPEDIPEPVWNLEQKEDLIKENIEKINQYDEMLVIQRWQDKEDGQVEWVKKGNIKWNPIATCYTLIYYIFKVLRWPIEDIRVIISYHKPTVKLSKIIYEIYKQYKIEEHFKESDIITKIVVWFVASMNTYGVIRPLFFISSTNSAFKLSQLCAMRQRHEQILYFITWPMRMDSNYIYILHNNSVIKKYEIREYLIDLHVEGKKKKIMKMIPRWMYTIIK
jgi:hypothetical protein